MSTVWINFPTQELNQIAADLVEAGCVHTLRCKYELGKFSSGDVLGSLVGWLVVHDVRRCTSIDQYPYTSRLSENQLKEIGNARFDWVTLIRHP